MPSAQVTDAPVVTRAELAKRLRVSKQTIGRWESEGLPVLRVGYVIRYRLPDVDRWLEQHYSRQPAARRLAIDT